MFWLTSVAGEKSWSSQIGIQEFMIFSLISTIINLYIGQYQVLLVPDMEKVVRLPRPRNIDLKISAIVRDSRVLQQTQQRILFKWKINKCLLL